MDEKPLVSVIITTKDSSRTIDRCLKSIKDQTYKPIEIIVVDNNSIDNTKEIARRYTKLIFDKGPERSAQRNFGAKKAKGKYFLIHDSDIYFHPKSVEECVNLAEETGCKAIILPEISIGDGYWAKVKAFERSFYIGNDLIEAARFFDKEAYWKVGGYDKNLTGPEDWDITIRFRNNGYLICRTKNFLLHDENHLDMIGASKKKKYYAKSFKDYKQKHPEIAKKQFSIRYRFPFSKILTKGLPHLILFISMVIMKYFEWRSIKNENSIF